MLVLQVPAYLIDSGTEAPPNGAEAGLACRFLCRNQDRARLDQNFQNHSLLTPEPCKMVEMEMYFCLELSQLGFPEVAFSIVKGREA